MDWLDASLLLVCTALLVSTVADCIETRRVRRTLERYERMVREMREGREADDERD